MEFWTNFIVFFVILIFYLHLQHEWKKGEDLEILEMDYISNKDLHEICKLKQPVIFQIDNFKETESLFQFVPEEKEEVIVKDNHDYYKDLTESIDGITLSYKSANGLFETDIHSRFFSENNMDFFSSKSFDSLFAPPLTVSKSCDYWFGSANAYTPTRFHTDSCRFLVILPGQGIRVKICPWRNRSTLNPMKDYEHYEFWSKTDIWKNNSIRCLEFDVKPGYVLYIPAYWFYSIQYLKVVTEEKESRVSSVACFQYITTMNMIANIHHYALYFLQQQNIITTKTRVLKKEDKEEDTEMEIKPEIKLKTKKEDSISPEIAETIAMLEPKPEINLEQK